MASKKSRWSSITFEGRGEGERSNHLFPFAFPSSAKQNSARLATSGCVVRFDPSADHEGHGMAPLADLRVAHAVDGFLSRGLHPGNRALLLRHGHTSIRL